MNKLQITKLVLPLITALSLTACSNDDDATSVIYYEGFEGGTVGDWKPNANATDNTAVSVDTTMGADGSGKSLYLDNTETTGDYSHGAAYITFPGGITPSYIGYYFRYKHNVDTTDTGGGSLYAASVVSHDNIDTTASNWVTNTEVSATGDGLDNLNVQSITVLNPLVSRDTWHHVEYRNIVFSADGINPGSYDIYLDDVEVETGVSMENGSTTIKAISIGNDNTGGGSQEVWFDEILIM